MTIWPDETEIQQLLKDAEEEDKKEKSNVVPLKVLPGGKGPGGYDWLSPMPSGTIFTCRHRTENLDKPWLDEYKINRKTEKTVQLISMPYSHQTFQGFLLVDPLKFTKHWELIEVIGVETDDGHRTDTEG